MNNETNEMSETLVEKLAEIQSVIVSRKKMYKSALSSLTRAYDLKKSGLATLKALESGTSLEGVTLEDVKADLAETQEMIVSRKKMYKSVLASLSNAYDTKKQLKSQSKPTVIVVEGGLGLTNDHVVV